MDNTIYYFIDSALVKRINSASFTSSVALGAVIGLAGFVVKKIIDQEQRIGALEKEIKRLREERAE